MLYRYSEVFRSLLAVADVTLVASAWLAAYWIRFYAGIPAPLGVPEFRAYLTPLLVILPTWLVLFRSRGLYEPQRMESVFHEAGLVIRATAIGIVLLVSVTFFVRSYFYSRGVILLFGILSPIAVIALRTTLRLGLRSLRRRGYNLRYVLIVGGGPIAEETVARIGAHKEVGLHIHGVLVERAGQRQSSLGGVPIIGCYTDLKQVLRGSRIDQVIIALPREESGTLEKLLADLDDEVVSVKLVPDLLHIMTLRSSVENFDGLPIINLRESPMVGWAEVQKRGFDLAVTSVGLLVALPLLGLIALAVWVSSGRPIFYSQQRVGFDGRVFRIYKIRSMKPGAEGEEGPGWTVPGDPRRTALGRWLRGIGLDELPQLWNVLRGEMSLVGPRPERPAFIDQFRREIPGYMLRHKVKAGLTGWAQVHGWRGDTSLHARIEHDIYYIQNWSLWLDLRILIMTLWRGVSNRNGY